LRSSAGLANDLVSQIKRQTGNSTFDRTISRSELWELRAAYGKFKIALVAELGILHSYLVTQKAGFDTFSERTYFPPILEPKFEKQSLMLGKLGNASHMSFPRHAAFIFSEQRNLSSANIGRRLLLARQPRKCAISVSISPQ